MSQSKLTSQYTERNYSYYVEKITLNLTIPNFASLYATAKANGTTKFLEEKFSLAGKNWGYHLQQSNAEDVGFYLEFFGPGCASVDYTVNLKTSHYKNVKTMSTGMRRYSTDESDEDAFVTEGDKRWKSLSALQTEDFLKDGSLKLQLILKLYSFNAHLKMKASADFKNGVDSSVGSDITFVFVEEGSQNVVGQIKAHSLNLSLRSPFFDAMLASGMKETTERLVTIDDMTPKSFRVLLNYIYSGDVDEEWGSDAEELIYGAHKYDLPDLQKYLCENVDHGAECDEDSGFGHPVQSPGGFGTNFTIHPDKYRGILGVS